MKTHLFILFYILLILFSACSRERFPSQNTEGVVLAVDISTTNLKVGAGDNNPERIKRLDFFLLKGWTVLSGWSNVDCGVDADNLKEMYDVDNKPVAKSFDKFLTDEEVGFINDGCWMMVFANLPGELIEKAIADKSLDEIVNRTLVKSDFDKPLGEMSPIICYGMSTSGFSFDSDLRQYAPVKPEGAEDGVLRLKHLPAKVVVGVSKTGSSIPGYEIDFENINITMYNLCRSTLVNNVNPDNNWFFNHHDDGDLVKSATSPASLKIVYDDGEEVMTANPFYTYFNDWLNDIKNETYAMIEVPIRPEGGDKYTKYYYKICVSNEYRYILCDDTVYDVRVSLRVLGGTYPELPDEIESASFKIMDWGEHVISCHLEEPRFVVAKQIVTRVYNSDAVKINFSSSGPCEIVDQSTQAYELISADSRLKSVDEVLNLENNRKAEISMNPNFYGVNNGYVLVEHPLLRDGDGEVIDNKEYRPYYITFTLRLKDRPEVYERLTVIQYPRQYVEVSVNSGSLMEHTKKYGNVFVGSQNRLTETDKYQSNCWRYVSDINKNSSDNRNPNMYVISVADKPAGGYIGDPTMFDDEMIDNLSRYKDYSGATLGSYRKCKNDPLSETMIAPKLRVASSYCEGVQSNRRLAELRCASYQEDGYPAGRWRLPTLAEAKYIVNLSAEGRIPSLFEVGFKYFGKKNRSYVVCNKSYWCSSGIFYILNYYKDKRVKYIESDTQLNFGENGGPYPADIYEAGSTSELTTEIPYYYDAAKMKKVAWNNKENTYTVVIDSYISAYVHFGTWVRCVYDEWRWGDDKCDKNRFTWGDDFE